MEIEKEIREPEIWKPIIGYEGLYEISSYGRLKRLSRCNIRIRKGYKNDKMYYKEIILKNTISKKGYHRNYLYHHDGINMVRKTIQIHVIVAINFIGKKPIDKPQINHKNGIKDDNYYKNLEWCDNTENQAHARENGLRPPNKKSWDYPHSKAVNMIDTINGNIITFGSIREAERQTKIFSTNIGKVLRGKRPKAGGFFWEYAKI